MGSVPARIVRWGRPIPAGLQGLLAGQAGELATQATPGRKLITGPDKPFCLFYLAVCGGVGHTGDNGIVLGDTAVL